MSTAVVLMAYGSPDRIEDVPGLLRRHPRRPADLAREPGRPRRALPDARDRGVEPAERDHRGDAGGARGRARRCPSSPGCGTGRRASPTRSSARSTPAPTRSSASCSRRTTRRMSIGRTAPARRGARRPRRAALRRAVGRRSRLRRAARRESCVRATAAPRRLHRALAPGADPRRGRPVPRTSCSRRRSSWRSARASTSGRSRSRASRRPGEPWLGPDILEHLDELAASGVRDVVVCPIGFVADHLEIRWDLDIEAAEQARKLGIRARQDRDAERRAGVRRRPRRARPAGGGCTVRRRENGRDPGRRGLAPLPRPRAPGAHAEGALRPPRAHRGDRRAGRSATSRSRSSRARRSA